MKRNDVPTAPPEPGRVGTVTEADHVIDTAILRGGNRLRNWPQDSMENRINPPDRDSCNTADAAQVDVVNYESGDFQTGTRSPKRSTDKLHGPQDL